MLAAMAHRRYHRAFTMTWFALHALVASGWAGLSANQASAQLVNPIASPGAESASDRLGRYVRILAHSPRDFQALIGAGRAALDMGDSQAAVGFFGRADEVWPASPLPQAGMGAATVIEGDADGALVYFTRAAKLGATALMLGADRGLAYDLLGRHAEAQADYRAALAGSESDEARRRLALSLAVSGDRASALTILSPLLIRRDVAAVRTRALVLALTGDMTSARAAVETAMPGSWPQMEPFIGRFGSLNSAQKVAAANLGIFPGADQPISPATSYANGRPEPSVRSTRPPADRLADIETLLRSPVAAGQPPATSPPSAAIAPQPQAGAIANASRAGGTGQRKRFWVQLASGANADALPDQMRRIRSRSEDLLNGVSAFIAEEPGRARLLVGPFRNASDADVFAEDLETLQVSAFRWISPEGQPVRKLTTE